MSAQANSAARDAATDAASRGSEENDGVRRYSDIRASIRDADLALFQGKGLFSKLCEIGGGGCYSHAAILFREPDQQVASGAAQRDRVRLVQATARGVTIDFMSEEIRDYQGAIELWRLRDPFARPPFDPAGAVTEARRHVGATYALRLLFGFFADWCLHPLLHRNFRSRTRSSQEFFCSELVSRAYRKGGHCDLNPRHGDAATGPGDLAKGGRIEHVHTFAHDDVLARR